MRLVFAWASILLAFAFPGAGYDSANRAAVERNVQASILNEDYSYCAEVLLRERLAPSGTSFDTDRMRWLRDSVPDLPWSTIRDYRRVRVDTSFVPALRTARPVRIIPDDTLRAYFSRTAVGKKGWIGFRDAFPRGGGITSISRVGLSHDGMWAIAYAGQQSDWLAGGGYLYVMRKHADVWRIERQFLLWVS